MKTRLVCRFALIVSCLAGSGIAVTVAAQDATPVFASTDREAFISSPEECAVEPLTAEQVDELASSTPLPPASPIAMDGPFAAPDGTPADPETVAAVTDVIRGSWGCLNGGDWARFFAYMTDEEALRAFGPDAIRSLASQPVAPFPLSDQTAVYAVLDVEVLEDGRVGAFVIVDTVQDPLPVEVNYQLFVESVEGWRLDGFICYAGTGSLC